jgi:hypothetical protein
MTTLCGSLQSEAISSAMSSTTTASLPFLSIFGSVRMGISLMSPERFNGS